MTANRLLNLFGFQAGWFSCVLGAAWGFPWLGPLVVLIFFIVHLYLNSNPGAELRLALTSAAVGFFFDSALSGAGLFDFVTNAPGVWFSPPWMVSLWVNFAATLRSSMSWLMGRPALAAFFGALGGPASYLAGDRLGAIELKGNVSLIVLAVLWGVAVPLLVGMAARTEKTEPERI